MSQERRKIYRRTPNWRTKLAYFTVSPEPIESRLRANISRGTWEAQSVKRPTSAQVMISQFIALSPY